MANEPPSHPLLAATLDIAMFTLRKVRRRVVPAAEGDVLELGLGTGSNLAHYRSEAVRKLVGVEPDPHMARRARARARKLGVDVEVVERGAEVLPFEDESFDTVVATFVLCTIPDPAGALAEARRVLRPGGRLLFAEHVRSPTARMARVQDALDGVWGFFSGGCHLNRDSVVLVEQAGFAAVTSRPHGNQGLSLTPVISGSALAPER